MHCALLDDTGVGFENAGQGLSRQGHIAQVDDIEEAGPKTVVDVVGIVGNVVRNRRHLRFC